MPLCRDVYEKEEQFVDKGIIRINKTICTIYMADEGETIISGGPAMIAYTVSKRTPTTLKTAYIRLGNVNLGWFDSGENQGIHIQEIPLPEPFQWKEKWPKSKQLVDCDITEKIKEEFGINIEDYL